MEIHFTKTNTRKTRNFKGTLGELLAKEGINPEEVVIVRDNIILTNDARITNKDKLQVLSVISGG